MIVVRECEVCATAAAESQSVCVVCETPLPRIADIDRGRAQVRWRGVPGGLALLLCVGSVVVGLIVGSQIATEAPSPVTDLVGECLNTTRYELMDERPIDASARRVACDSALAYVQILSEEDECGSSCFETVDQAGASFQFVVIPRAGQCFFAYEDKASGNLSGWPANPYPCDASVNPDDFIVEGAAESAKELGVKTRQVRLVSLVVTRVTQRESQCSKGAKYWLWPDQDPARWICAAVIRAV